MFAPKNLIFTLNKCLKRQITRNLTLNAAPVAVDSDEVNKPNTIIVEKDGPVTIININRPETRNSLDISTAQSLSDALDAFEQDQESSVAILHGNGGNFCSGYDLKEIAKYDGENEDNVPQFGPLSNRNSLCSKPLVAAISGCAIGVGFELALMCDLRLAEEDSTMGFLNRRFGIPVMCGGTVRLPALIGYSQAIHLILTGKPISCEEALKLGLLHDTCAVGSVLGRARGLATSLTKFPQKTLLADRASAHYAAFSSKNIDEALQFEKDGSGHLLFEEGVEGAKKFVEKGIGRHGKFYNIKEVDTKSFRELDKDLI